MALSSIAVISGELLFEIQQEVTSFQISRLSVIGYHVVKQGLGKGGTLCRFLSARVCGCVAIRCVGIVHTSSLVGIFA